MTTSRHRGAHRAGRRAVERAARLRERRRRAGLLAAAVATTLAVGVSALVSQVGGGPAQAEPAVGDAALPAVQTASLPEVEPVEPSKEGKKKEDDASPGVASVQAAAQADVALPADSGTGRRIVFSESRQRVWLLDDAGKVQRTYLVSGSIHDNLDPGTYAVQARFRNATAYDYSSTMEYFVQFTRGPNAPIGFHTVPVDGQGRLEQTREQLGTPLSAGCVRQWRDDAVALWDFAPVGTTVVVTA